MPRITYTPTGVETGYTFDFDFSDMDSTHAMLVEKLTGLNWGDVPNAFFGRNMRTIHALLFVLAKGNGTIPANTPAASFKFTMAEVDLDLSTFEAQAAYDGMLAKLDELDDDERTALEELGKRDDVRTGDDVEPVAVDEVEVEGDPKA